VGSELFHIDGRRDGFDETASAFRNFGNASKTDAQTCFKNLNQEYYSTLYVDGNMDIMLTELNFLDDFRQADIF
jgi:hypothetical protein